MTHNILLTSLDAPENRPLRYYAARNEFGYDYCEAAQSMEASTKYILARFPIDSILVIGEEVIPDDGDGRKPVRLRDAGDLYAADPASLSAFGLYRSRIAQHIDEVSLAQQAYDALLPEAQREKLIDFIRGWLEQRPEGETKRLNRLFDALARSRQLYNQFMDALFNTFPEFRRDSRRVMKWVKNYLYTQLKPSSKLEVLPVNENVCARYIPADMLEKREYWFSDVLDVDQDVLEGRNEINIYLSLGNDSSVDPHMLLNILDILISTPGSNVHLKKIYRVTEAAGDLTGEIEDNTMASRSTELVAAAHAFLNYSKTDMLMDVWKNCGGNDERINRLIAAARHVDVGISMCNIPEVQEGIELLRGLFQDERSWSEVGDYGILFGMIAGCVQADYSAMLESDGKISFIELIKWAYKHQLYQQVLTLIEAHAPSNLVEAGIFYYCDDEKAAPEVTKLFALQRLEMKSYEYYKLDDINHYFVKYYDRASVSLSGSRGEDRNLAYALMRTQSIEKQDPEKISGHTACGSMDTVQNVLYAYYHLGEVRNKVSHADTDALLDRRRIPFGRETNSAMTMMKESIEYFITSYEKAQEEARGRQPKIVAISPDDVRNAANRLRSARPQEGRNSSGRRD